MIVCGYKILFGFELIDFFLLGFGSFKRFAFRFVWTDDGHPI